MRDAAGIRKHSRPVMTRAALLLRRSRLSFNSVAWWISTGGFCPAYDTYADVVLSIDAHDAKLSIADWSRRHLLNSSSDLGVRYVASRTARLMLC